MKNKIKIIGKLLEEAAMANIKRRIPCLWRFSS